jgi:phosphate transport system substrate-binding protein
MKRTILSVTALAGAALLTSGIAVGDAQKVDPNLAKFTPVSSGVSGEIRGVGSDTMLNLFTAWGEGFKKVYPSARTAMDGKGSSAAPPALIQGTAAFGPMSRAMKAEEIDEFEKKFGYKPTGLKAAVDALAVIVHKDNPLKSITLPQVDAVFSKTRKGGGPADIRTWGDLGLTGEWASKPISLYGRNTASGTYGYFKEHALYKGDFKDTVKEQAGTSSVVGGVAADRYAIGYGGIGYLTADVRALPLSKDGKLAPVEATADNCYAGTYPMARFLLLYVNHKPGSELDPLRREFIRYVFSQAGQEVVIDQSYFPVKAVIANEALKSVGISVHETPAEKPMGIAGPR